MEFVCSILFDNINKKKHQQDFNDQAKPSPRKDKNAIQLRRLANRWIPLGKKFVVEGVIIEGVLAFIQNPRKPLQGAMLGNPPSTPRNSNPYRHRNPLTNFATLANTLQIRSLQLFGNTSRQSDVDPTLHEGQMLCHMLLGKP